MHLTSTQSIVPGLLRRSFLRFERTTFRALAELLEDLGALAYHRYAVLDERCTWRDTRFDDSPAPHKGRGPCRQHVNSDPTNGEAPAPPGVADSRPAPTPSPDECPNGRDVSLESHVACRGGGQAACRHEKPYFGLSLVDACPHDKAHVGLPLPTACPHEKAYFGLPLVDACPHDKARLGLPTSAACLHDKTYWGLPFFGACPHDDAHFGLPLFGACSHDEAHFGRLLSRACLHRCHRG